MLDGRLTRVFVLCLLLLAPAAYAANPEPNRPTGDSTDGQDITGLAIDPSGQFVAAVVAFDPAKVSTPTLPLPGQPQTSPRKDIYLCDYGPATQPTAGSGCNGVRHAASVGQATQAANAPQRVAATAVDAGGRQGWFAVAGPGSTVSLWRSTSQVAEWTRTAADNQQALNVTIAPDASRVIAGVAPTSVSSGGRIEVRHKNGSLAWDLPLVNLEGANVRPTVLEYSREEGVVAIGTTDGLLLVNGGGDKPSGGLGGLAQADAVHSVALSRRGEHVALGAENGVFLASVKKELGKLVIDTNTVFNRNFGEPAQLVALSLDGTRFAAAAGSKIYFFRRLDSAAIAEPIGEPYDTRARVTDLAYDDTGSLLVAVSGNRVMGFGPNKNAPIWNFDATETQFGSLDGPLRHVGVSDDGTRVIVAGKTKTMAYSARIGVKAGLTSSTGVTTIVPTQTLQLALTVNNTGSLSDNYKFSVTTPISWQDASAEDLRLDPEDSRTVRFNVTAPAGADPGVYAVRVKVRSDTSDALALRRAQSPKEIAEATFNITIPRSVILKVEAPDERFNLRQGAEQTIPFVIRNEGNADAIVNLSEQQTLTAGTAWDVRFTPGKQVTVPAGGSTPVSLVLTAPSGGGTARNVVTISAKEGPVGGPIVEATDQITAYVAAEFGAELRANATWDFFPGQSQVIRLNVTNIGTVEDTYNLSYVIKPEIVQSDWKVTMEQTQVSIDVGQTKVIAVTVRAVASELRAATLELRTESRNSPERTENTLPISLQAIDKPPADDRDDDRLLPGPAPAIVLLAIALIAFARRATGGRP